MNETDDPHRPTPRPSFRFASKWTALTCGFIIVGCATPAGLAQRPTSNPQRNFKTSVGEPAPQPTEPNITFGRIDPMGKRCVVVYGGPSLSDKGFLIQDCGGPRWEKKWIVDSGYITRMFFQDQTNDGWFVTGGALVRIKESGIGFDLSVERYNQNEKIRDVFFINDRVGWICGMHGAIYKTEDGGKTWQQQESHTKFELNEIRFLNSLEGWINGSGSTVLLTSDGGNTWSPLNTRKRGELSPVFFTTSLKQGCGIDDDESIVCTDGAGKWRKVYSDKGERKVKRAIFFLNERQGWVAGDCIWHTEDGGKSWEKQFQLPENKSLTFEQVVFVDEKLGWAQTLQGVWRTRDGGKTWTNISDTWMSNLLQKDY